MKAIGDLRLKAPRRVTRKGQQLTPDDAHRTGSEA